MNEFLVENPSPVRIKWLVSATNEAWIDSDKGKQERTEWHNIVAWNKLADFSTQYILFSKLYNRV